MTPKELPLQKIKQTILTPDASFSDGIGRFACRDRFALTIDDWLILIADQSFQFSKYDPSAEWKAIANPSSTKGSLHLFDIFVGGTVVAMAAHLEAARPLVALLHKGGKPPATIERDWQKQLTKLGKQPPNVCRVLCDSEGLLTVIPDLKPPNNLLGNPLAGTSPQPSAPRNNFITDRTRLQLWHATSWPWLSTDSPGSAVSKTANPTIPKSQIPVDAGPLSNASSPPLTKSHSLEIDHPAEAVSPTTPVLSTSPKNTNTNRPDLRTPSPNKKQKSKSTRQRSIALTGTAIAATLIALAMVWKSLPSSTQTQNVSPPTLEVEETLAQSESKQPENVPPHEAPLDTLSVSSDSDMTELADSDTLPSLDSLTSELNSVSDLEMQLQDKVVLDELDTSNIIARSLNRQSDNNVSTSDTHSPDDTTPLAEMSMITTEDLNNDPLNQESTNEQTADATTEQSVPATNTSRKDRLSAASKREKINFGLSVIPKDAAWTAQLVVEDPTPKSFMVNPSDLTNNVGPGKVTWVLALEDEDPEVIVEILAKPGRRWDIVWQVGFRESREDAPRLLGPTDANQVLNQLISAKTLLGRMLTMNQIARDSRVRGPIDLFEQRRQLQRQERELDQSIERWKIIESLSQLAFKQSQVEFQALSPTTTPPTPAEPISPPQ